MRPQIKIAMLFVIVTFPILACGQLDIGIESTRTQPAPISNTPTTAAGRNRQETLQITENQPPEAFTEVNTPPTVEERLTLDCSEFGRDPLISAACNIQDSFISRNTQPLLSYMPDEFILAYWQSEGTTVSPADALDFFQNSLLPPNPQDMTFTIDRDDFPPLFGMPADQMFGPNFDIALIIYSEGWGKDGRGAVLIYLAGDTENGYTFPAMVIASDHFDQ